MDRKKELISVGERALLAGAFEKAAWAFDSVLCLTPGRRDANLWQRGLACFYRGRYEEGARQFQEDMSANGSDIEEVVWHFLCRCKMSGFARSQSEGFLPLRTGDPGSPPPPAPMPQVLQLYQGTGTVEDVFKAARNPDGSPASSYNGTNALAYASFYVGLFYEVQGDLVRAAQHFKAAADCQNPDYIGKMMTMHFKLISRKLSPLQCSSQLHLTTMQIPQGSSIPSRSCTVSRVIQGGWQLSLGHRPNSGCSVKSDVIVELLKSYDAGIWTFDCGDIYTGVEELRGAMFRALKQRSEGVDVSIFTKLVPDLDVIRMGKVDETYVRSVIRRSLNRLGLDRLSLVQFHWWDYNFPGYLAALHALNGLVKEGLVEHIGLTNFDTEHTREIIEEGLPIVSTQVHW